MATSLQSICFHDWAIKRKKKEENKFKVSIDICIENELSIAVWKWVFDQRKCQMIRENPDLRFRISLAHSQRERKVSYY